MSNIVEASLTSFWAFGHALACSEEPPSWQSSLTVNGIDEMLREFNLLTQQPNMFKQRIQKNGYIFI